MSEITVFLSEERLQQLREVALRAGVRPEELARASLEDWLRQPREDFEAAARYEVDPNGWTVFSLG